MLETEAIGCDQVVLVYSVDFDIYTIITTMEQEKELKTLTLNRALGVSVEELEKHGVLNTMIGIDTKLFIDPKLVGKTGVPELNAAHQKIHEYFELLVRVNAQASKSERVRQKAIDMIAIDEPVGLLIGYGNSRDSGKAIPASVAVTSLKSLTEILRIGIEDLRVMELLGLFVSNFGSDSISDLIAHILYDSLCQFTQRVAKEMNIKTSEFTIHGNKYQLPVHPYNKKQIVFVPSNAVRELPLASSWEEVADAAGVNEVSRKSFNEMIGAELDNFVKKIRKNPELLISSKDSLDILIDVYSQAEVLPYDRKKDPKGYVRVTELLSELSDTLTAKAFNIKDATEMKKFIGDEIVSQFKREIELLGKNRLLYHRDGEAVNPKKPVHEEASQIIFHGIADILAQKSNIIVTRESKTGVGSVDFSFGNVPSNKVVVEIKKSDNGNLLNGYENQVTAYQEAEGAAGAVYVVVIVRDSNVSNRHSQLNELQKLHAQKVRDNLPHPDLYVIDGRIKDTASKKK